MVTIKQGNLLGAKEKVIAHQVNCQGAAAGLAAAIFRKWPYARKDYTDLTTRLPARTLLGMAQFTGQQKDGHIICNLYGQYEAGAAYNPEKLEQALTQLGNTARIMEWSVALPWKLSCVIYQREGDL